MAFIDNSILFLLLTVFCFEVNSRQVNNSSIDKQNSVQYYKDVFDKNFEKIEINRFCDSNDNCTHSLLCIDNQCRCQPNHKWNRFNKECESYDCKRHESECKASDPNRVCRHVSLSSGLTGLFSGSCECSHGYFEDNRNLKCRKFCHKNIDCDPSLTSNAPTNNMVCVDFLCHCRPNTRFNITVNECQTFNCTKDVECWTGADENRECKNGQCVCNFQEDLDSTKCYLSLYSLFRFRNYSTRNEKLLLLSLFIMPSVVLYCIYSQHKKRKLLKLIAKTNENKAPVNFIYLTKNQELKTTKI